MNVVLFCAGEPQSFNLKFKRAEDYPIDLYYLMDLSFSMKDDLENVKNLGTSLTVEMSKITTDFRIGRSSQTPFLSSCTLHEHLSSSTGGKFICLLSLSLIIHASLHTTCKGDSGWFS